MKRRWEWEFDVPREALWRYIADTDWVNRHAGLPKISTRAVAKPNGEVQRLASFRIGPMVTEWEERPTLWRAPEFYEVERRYLAGPLRLFLNRTSLLELDARRTRVVMDVTMEARSPALTPLLLAIARQGKAGADRAFSLAARLVRGEASDAVPLASGRLERLRDTGMEPAAIASLERMLAESDDRELTQIRPYEIADRYGVPRKAMLRTFLAATRAGYFNLRWDVICPSCRGTPNSFDTLSELRADLHCATCNVPYGPQFDRSVEVTFNAKPLGRGVDVPLYCIASPQRSAHVITQTPIEARGSVSIDLPFAAGSYDFNAVGVGIAPFTASADAPARSAWGSVEPLHVSFPHEVAASTVALRIDNNTDREQIVRVEEGRWPDTIATAAHVTAFSDFRDMFSSEVLAPGLELGIESLAILFTDLVGSTAMYSRAGDAPAFKIVTDHFARMRAVIEANGGTIVKTIGDAVMAVFLDPVSALRAALQLDGAVRDLHHAGEPLRLRVGFHAGPCIAMRANDRIDYFGTAVNLAARLQSKAGAGEVTVSQDVARRPDVERALADAKRHIANESVDVKGFAAPVAILRIS